MTADFEQLNDYSKRIIMDSAFRARFYSVCVDKESTAFDTNIEAMLTKDDAEEQEILNYIFDEYRLCRDDQTKLSFLQSLTTNTVSQGTFEGTNQAFVSQTHVGQPEGEMIQMAAVFLQNALKKTGHSKIDTRILTMIHTGQLATFFKNFFQETDQRAGSNATNQMHYIKTILEIKVGALESHSGPQPLQQFYGQSVDPHLRGTLKLESNPIFKDTDELTKFIKQYFFLE